MFDNLSNKFGSVFDKLRGKASLSEGDVDIAMREIRMALLEADVALPVAKAFIERVKSLAIGQDVIKGVNPGQQVVKIVHDSMIDMLGGNDEDRAINLNMTPPAVILMAGLQGSGKTTSTAKIARFLRDKQGKKVLMASLDTQRPAAQEQLAVLGDQTQVATLPIILGQGPVDIAKRAIDSARKEGFDVLILDTAGRLSIDDALMDEMKAIKEVGKPCETLLVTDAMTGQDAVHTAKNFHDKIGVTGIVLTRIDGDARGGAAMSMKAVTGMPIKLLGTGEKWDAIEVFHPDRIVSRILGMGDVVSLVEKAAEAIDHDDAQKMAAKLQKGQFDLNDYLSQIRSMQKMGGMGALMKMIPGIGKMAGKMEEMGGENVLKGHEVMIQSMTKKERERPTLLNASRRKRIARGSGKTVQDVNKLLKQHQQMQNMMKKIRKMGMGGLMKQMQGMLGDDNMDKLAQMGDKIPGMQGGTMDGMSPQDMAKMAELEKQMGGALSGGGMPSAGMPGMPGMPGVGGAGDLPGLAGLGMPGLGGAGTGKRGVTKKIKSKRKKNK